METFFISPENKVEQEKGKLESIIFNEENIRRTVENIKNAGEKLGEGNYGAVHTLDNASNYCVKTNKALTSENDPIEELDFLEVARDLNINVPTPRALVVDGHGKDKNIYLFMDTIDGLSLRDIMDHNSLDILPAGFDFFKFFEKLEADITKMNEFIYHRDIKPDNVLLDKDGAPWIIDFGQSKWVKDLKLNENTTFAGDLKNFRDTRIVFAKFLKDSGMSLKKKRLILIFNQ